VLKTAAREITLTLMTPCRVTPQSGVLALEGRLRVAYDSTLTPSVEEITLDDARLRGVWGGRLYRILLRAAAAGQRGKFSMRLSHL
jgi:hypothetical protein